MTLENNNKNETLTQEGYEKTVNGLLLACNTILHSNKKLFENRITPTEFKQINEDAWEKAKYYMSKLGRYKAGGKIFGQRKTEKEAAIKIKDILLKKGNEMIKKLDDSINTANPKFPNNEKEELFLQTVLQIAAVYDSIVAATKKNPDEDGYLPVDAANIVIEDLAEYVKKFLDVDIRASYSIMDSKEPASDEYGINEDEMSDEAPDEAPDASTPLKASNVRAGLQTSRGDGEQRDSQRMDTLNSKRLPMTLVGIGASLGAFSWLVNTDWFRGLYEHVINIPGQVGHDAVTGEVSKHLGNVKAGDGLTQTLNAVNHTNLNLQSSPEELLNQCKILGGGDVNKGIEAMTAKDGMFVNPVGAKSVLQEIARNPHGHGNNLGEIFKGNWAGTGKEAGDLLVTHEGGQLSRLITVTIMKAIPTIAAKTAIRIGAGYGVAHGLGAILGPIGIGLVLSGILVQAMRMKGRKSSRAKTLKDLLDSLQPLNGTPENPIVITEPSQDSLGQDEPSQEVPGQDEPSQDGALPNDQQQQGGKGSNKKQVYNSLTNFFRFIVNNQNVMGGGKSSTVKYDNDDDLTVGHRVNATNPKTNKPQSVPARYDKETGKLVPNGNFDASGKFIETGERATRDISKKNLQGGINQRGQNMQNADIGESNLPLLYEGVYIQDKRTLEYLNKSGDLSFDKVKRFEEFLTRLENIRNIVRNMNNTGDKVIGGFIGKMQTNPIMVSNFVKLFNVPSNNPDGTESLRLTIIDIFKTLYAGEFKFGNIIDKMRRLGSGNINKNESYEITEDKGAKGYNALNPNEVFLKDANSRASFKKHLVAFITELMNMYQYLYKLNQEGKLDESVETKSGNLITEAESLKDKLISEDILRIKHLMSAGNKLWN